MLILTALLAVAFSQFIGNETPYDYYETIDTHADVGLNVSVSEFFVNDTTFPFTTKSVVFKFSDMEMYAKYKPKLTRETSPDSIYSEEGNMAYVSGEYCTSQTWPSVGRSQNAWIVANDTDFLYQTYAYGETFEYNDIPRPYLQFTVDVFGADPKQTDCSDTGAVNKISQDYKDIKLCWSQNWECNLWFGNPDGYLYLPNGPEANAKFGFRLEPSWNVTGLHVNMVINTDEVFTVKALSDETLFDTSKGEVPWMYFESYTANYFGYTAFVIDQGILQRYVYADTIKLDSWAGFAFDCSNNLDKWSKWTAGADSITWNGTIFEASYSLDDTDAPVDQFWAEPFNYPAGYEPKDFGTFTLRDGKFIDVSFTFEKIKTTVAGVTATTVPTTPRPTATTGAPTTAPTFTCPKNCDGKGVCTAQDKCNCIANYVNDPVLGCRRNDEQTKATVTVVTVPVSTITATVSGVTQAKVTDKPTIPTKSTMAGTRPVQTQMTTAKPTVAPQGPTTTAKAGSSSAVTIAFEIAVALFAVIALLI